MTLGIGSLAMASASAFCRPSASVAPLARAVEEQRLGLAVHARGCRPGHGRRRRRPATASFLSSAGVALPAASSPTRHRHQLLRDRACRRPARHVGEVRGQAARRGIGGQHRAGIGQALRHELVAQHAGKGVAELLQRLGRQFLDEEFDEQVVLECSSLRPPSSSSGPPTRAAPSGSPAARGSRSSSAPRCARGCGCGRCRRRARSR